jgi:DNA polymerase-3 subunit delta'
MEAAELTSSGRAPVTIEIYPWHEQLWRRITRELARLPHALLLHGEEGIGKRGFALRLARLLLCRSPLAAHEACGECAGCRLFAAGTHPDLLVVAPLEKSSQITVDQVRALAAFLALKPHQAARKIVVLSPAQAMNLNAANSLLKVLEEPPPGSLLLLAAHQPQRLPATIRSRCAQMPLVRPTREEGSAWLAAPPRALRKAEELLALAGGAPLRALALAENGFQDALAALVKDLEGLATGERSAVECAARWKATGSEHAMRWLYGLVGDLVRRASADAGPQNANQAATAPGLGILFNNIKNKELYIFLDAISDSINQLDGPLDEQLLLENLLIRWSRLAHGSATIKTQNR